MHCCCAMLCFCSFPCIYPCLQFGYCMISTCLCLLCGVCLFVREGGIDYLFVVLCCSFHFMFVSLLYINFCLCVGNPAYVCLWEKGVLTPPPSNGRISSCPVNVHLHACYPSIHSSSSSNFCTLEMNIL